jgi:hypothetical protein
MTDYNSMIESILHKDESELYCHYADDSYIFGDGNWKVIVRAQDGIIVTSFPPFNYDKYLFNPQKEYYYLGTIEEVRHVRTR